MDYWKLARRIACILLIAAFFAAGLAALWIGKPETDSQIIAYDGHQWISDAGKWSAFRRVRTRDPLREIDAAMRGLDTMTLPIATN